MYIENIEIVCVCMFWDGFVYFTGYRVFVVIVLVSFSPGMALHVLADVRFSSFKLFNDGFFSFLLLSLSLFSLPMFYRFIHNRLFFSYMFA